MKIASRNFGARCAGNAVCLAVGQTRFPPLKVRVEDPMEFYAVLGIIPDDLHLFGCTTAEDPLRIPLNTSGEWVHPTTEPLRRIPPTSLLTQDELDIEEFRETAAFDIPERITPFLRSSMIKSNEVGKWNAPTQSPRILEEFGSSRGKSDAKMRSGNTAQIPISRSGKQMNRQVVWCQHMTLGDCCIQEVCISELRFTAVDYGDIIPTSEGLQQILGFTQRGKNQCAILRLAAGLVHLEVGSKRPPTSGKSCSVNGQIFAAIRSQTSMRNSSLHASVIFKIG